MKSFLSVFLLVFLCVSPAIAEFSIGDNLDVSFNTHGNIDYHAWDVSATYPLDFINGYIGAEWMRSKESDNMENPDDHHYLRARLEGGYQKGIFGLMFYGRYGKRSTIFQNSLFQGGSFIHLDIIQKTSLKFNIALGAWLSDEELSAKYDVDPGLKWGYQTHLNFNVKELINVYAEFLPEHDIKDYRVRVLPTLTIPISKIGLLNLNLISFQVSGEIYYDSLTHHADIKPWQWQWKNGLKFGF